MPFLIKYALKDGEMVEDPDGSWCSIDFVEHLVHNLQQDLILLKSKTSLMEEELIRRRETDDQD